MDKRTVIINRRHCWVRKSSEMDWYKDSEPFLNSEKEVSYTPQNSSQTLEIVPIDGNDVMKNT